MKYKPIFRASLLLTQEGKEGPHNYWNDVEWMIPLAEK